MSTAVHSATSAGAAAAAGASYSGPAASSSGGGAPLVAAPLLAAPRLYSIPTPDGETVDVSSDELPDSAGEIVEVLRTVGAPLRYYLDFGAEYYRQGRLQQFEALAAAGIAVGTWRAVLRRGGQGGRMVMPHPCASLCPLSFIPAH
jgi:hypothetical protein